ncbi:hypothetical protein FOCC_FOCC003897 [Frankliniella occidentalis]|nr:hypothetical protein FOCC_FOCC003897 [Frankliniella occidentalis]
MSVSDFFLTPTLPYFGLFSTRHIDSYGLPKYTEGEGAIDARCPYMWSELMQGAVLYHSHKLLQLHKPTSPFRFIILVYIRCYPIPHRSGLAGRRVREGGFLKGES